MVSVSNCKRKTYAKSKQIFRKFAKLSPPFSTEFSPLYMCCNIHHFGITKRNYKTTSYAHKTTSYAHKLKLQVMRSKLTSLTAETNKFQLTNMLFITF